jgi:hypothetical protein
MSYTYTTILTSQTIGDSLSSVNLNYITLEQETLNLQLTSTALWQFMQQYYIEFGSVIKDAVNTVNSISSSLNTTVTVVQNNSAGWIKPISIIYPSIFYSGESQSTILQVISSWVNQYYSYSIFSENSIQPNYVQSQKLIVYAHTSNINNNCFLYTNTPTVSSYNTSYGIQSVLQDQTICYTQNEKISLNCIICYSGGTYCDVDTWFDCNGNCTSCSVPGELDCYYNSPYINTVAQQGTGYIKATTNTYYNDINESVNINAFVFSVQNCNWVYTGGLNG